jgi:hypothetical protein
MEVMIIVGDKGPHIMEEGGIDEKLFLVMGIIVQTTSLRAAKELLGEPCNRPCMVLADAA